jgi:hypothetical protein
LELTTYTSIVPKDAEKSIEMGRTIERVSVIAPILVSMRGLAPTESLRKCPPWGKISVQLQASITEANPRCQVGTINLYVLLITDDLKDE